MVGRGKKEETRERGQVKDGWMERGFGVVCVRALSLLFCLSFLNAHHPAAQDGRAAQDLVEAVLKFVSGERERWPGAA
jgi:hypothetical protein